MPGAVLGQGASENPRISCSQAIKQGHEILAFNNVALSRKESQDCLIIIPLGGGLQSLG